MFKLVNPVLVKDEVYDVLRETGEKRRDSAKNPDKLTITGYYCEGEKDFQDINGLLLSISEDKKLLQAVNDYGLALKFAGYEWSGEFYRGYSHLLLQPREGLVMVRRDIVWPTFEFEDDPTFLKEVHSGTFVRKGMVYTPRPQFNDAIPVAAEIIGASGPRINYDKTKAPTVERIAKSLENAMLNAY